MNYFLPFKRNPLCFKPLNCLTKLFQNSFLPFTISEWYKLDPGVRDVDTFTARKTMSSLFICSEKMVFP